MHEERAVERLDSVDKAAQTGPALRICAPNSVVNNFDHDEPVGRADAHHGTRRMRVLRDVRQGLRYDVVLSRFDALWQVVVERQLELDDERCTVAQRLEGR